MSYRWLDHTGAVLPIEGKRTLLLPREAVAPGESDDTKLEVVAPPNKGIYTLRVSMVHEGITWFDQGGGKPLDLPVKVD